jgi:hypothetical protein
MNDIRTRIEPRRRPLTDADLEFPVSRARRRAGAALEVAFWFLAVAGVALGLAAILME